MTLHGITDAPPKELAEALARFEAQFTYPLGPGRCFRISHGSDYSRFYRAMGESTCFVAESDGIVQGTLSAAVRPLKHPDGQKRPVLYLGDLKVAPGGRSGRTLLTLANAMQRWAEPRVAAAYGIVMDGTRGLPQQYTGRLGIPPFREIGKIAVIRLPTTSDQAGNQGAWDSSETAGPACFRELSAGQCVGIGGFPEMRSEQPPLWLVKSDGAACGRLEDTRQAKRLISDDDMELRSAHLSCFAFRDPLAGAALLKVASRLAAIRGFPALFFSVAVPVARVLCRDWTESEIVIAPATVYGTGLEPQVSWNINTAEI